MAKLHSLKDMYNYYTRVYDATYTNNLKRAEQVGANYVPVDTQGKLTFQEFEDIYSTKKYDYKITEDSKKHRVELAIKDIVSDQLQSRSEKQYQALRDKIEEYRVSRADFLAGIETGSLKRLNEDMSKTYYEARSKGASAEEASHLVAMEFFGSP